MVALRWLIDLIDAILIVFGGGVRRGWSCARVVALGSYTSPRYLGLVAESHKEMDNNQPNMATF